MNAKIDEETTCWDSVVKVVGVTTDPTEDTRSADYGHGQMNKVTCGVAVF